jgi:hypothetical protein
MALSERPLDVMTATERLGFHIHEALVDGKLCWAWSRGADQNWPVFSTKDAALAWMEDRIHDGTLFDR